MGGFVQDNESKLRMQPSASFFELTGLDNVYMEQVRLLEKSIAIRENALFRLPIMLWSISINMTAPGEGSQCVLGTHQRIPLLLFDHLQMVIEANMLLRRVSHEPVGFSIRRNFTLGQLQSLYEAMAAWRSTNAISVVVWQIWNSSKRRIWSISPRQNAAPICISSQVAYSKSPKFKL